jgi:hypothetical protein
MRSAFPTTSLLSICATLALLAGAAVRAQEKLYSLSVNESERNGKMLIATMRETERQADFSLVELEVVSEGGPSSLLFLARGFCGLMLARGQHNALAEQTSEHPIRFRVDFPKALAALEGQGPPRLVLTETQCAALPK